MATLERLIGEKAEERQQFALLSSQTTGLLSERERLRRRVEDVASYLIDTLRFLVSIVLDSASEDRFDTKEELLHTKRLRDVVVSTGAESLKYVLPHTQSGEEDNGYVGRKTTNVLSQCQSISLGHHDIQETEIVLRALEGFPPLVTIGTKGDGELLTLKELLKDCP